MTIETTALWPGGVDGLSSMGFRDDDCIEMRWDWRSSTGNDGEPATPRALAEYVEGDSHPTLKRIEVLIGVHGTPVGVWIRGTSEAGENAGERFDRASRHYMRWSWVPKPIRRFFGLATEDFGDYIAELGAIIDDLYAGFAGAFDQEAGKLTLTCGWGGDAVEKFEATVDGGPISGTKWSIALDARGFVKRVEVDGFGKCLTDLQGAMFSSEAGDAYFDVPEFQEEVTGYFGAMQLPTPAWLHQPQLRTADAISQTRAAIGKREDAKLAAAFDDRLPYDFDELLGDVWALLATGEPRSSE